MLLVPTVLGPSTIHGTGVFAASPIPAGTCIWEFSPGVDWRISPEDLEAFPEPYRTQLRAWCYRDTDDHYVLCGDAAKFMNHADAPNCDDPDGRHTLANRDIAAGDELTCDYRTFDRDSAAKGLDFNASP